MPGETKGMYEFGPYRLDAARRTLSRGGEPLPLTSKLFDTLLALVGNRERVLLKDELMNLVWPDSFVEEVNLAQNISALRKLLGESPGQNRYIATIPGKGYRFVSEVRDAHEPVREIPAVVPGGEPARRRETTSRSRSRFVFISTCVCVALAGFVYVI